MEPTNQSTLIVSGYGTTISSFDGEEVDWHGPYAYIPSLSKCTVTIPAGKHTLIANSILKPVDYNFVAGKTYTAKIKTGVGTAKLVITEEQ
jgi:hypothetical protein